MKRLRVVVPAFIVVSLATIACGGDGGGSKATPEPTTAQVQEITIRSGDWFYNPNQITVRPGTIRVTHVNEGPGQFGHTFNVKNKNGEGELVRSDRIEIGERKTVEFTITEEGTYQMLCLVRGHAERGHVGSLVVSSSAPAPRS